MNVRDQGHNRKARILLSGVGAGCVRELGQGRQCLSLVAGRILVLPQQIGWINLQHPGDLLDRAQARVIPAALEQADIGPVQLSLMGKVLLGKILRLPCGSKIASKTLPYVHRTHHSRLQRILATEYTLQSHPTPHLSGKSNAF